jgi:chitodextrinase
MDGARATRFRHIALLIRVAARRVLPVLAAAVVVAAVAVLGVALPARADVPDTERPSQPGALVATDVTTTSLTLTWAASTDNVGVTGYDVMKIYTDMVFTLSTSTNSIVVTGQFPSHTYRFSVRARDAAGNFSTGTSYLTITMPPGDSVAPTVPGTPVASNVANTALTLTWTRSTDNVLLGRYEVYRIDGATRTHIASVFQIPGGGSTWRVTGLTENTTYTFAVLARDDAGNGSALSGTVTVTTTTGPDVTPPADAGHHVHP